MIIQSINNIKLMHTPIRNNNCSKQYCNNTCYASDSANLIANYNKANLSFCSKKELELDKLTSLNIPNMHIIDNECVRGESLSSKKNRKYISLIKKCGIKNVVDLRDKYSSSSYEEMCNKNGLKYYHIPIDSNSVEDRTIISNLPKLFLTLDNGKTYIACAQGLHRTDIALALNYIFNPNANKPPVMYGHFRDYGFKSDDIARRINSIKKSITEEDIKKLGWDKDIFAQETQDRKKKLFEFNTNQIN